MIFKGGKKSKAGRVWFFQKNNDTYIDKIAIVGDTEQLTMVHLNDMVKRWEEDASDIFKKLSR